MMKHILLQKESSFYMGYYAVAGQKRMGHGNCKGDLMYTHSPRNNQDIEKCVEKLKKVGKRPSMREMLVSFIVGSLVI